jgi:hypothetical protein
MHVQKLTQICQEHVVDWNPYGIHYDRQNTDWAYWYDKAKCLREAAHLVWLGVVEKRTMANCLPVYRMLMGYSFELLLKATHIKDGLQAPYSHDLGELAKAVAIRLSRTEMDILNVLKGYIVWDGRYPTPKSPEMLMQHWKATENVESKSTPTEIGLMLAPNDNLDYQDLLLMWRKISDPLFATNLEDSNADQT